MSSVEIDHNESLRNCMRMMVSIRKDMHLPDDFYYSCSEDVVLQYGKEFIPTPLQKPYVKDTPKYCFFNSYKLALEYPSLLYVEGFAMIRNLPIPIHHAWCIDKNDPYKVIDVTADLESYIGIPFKRNVFYMNWKTGSLLDDWKGNWKLMRTSPEQLKKKYLYSKIK